MRLGAGVREGEGPDGGLPGCPKFPGHWFFPPLFIFYFRLKRSCAGSTEGLEAPFRLSLLALFTQVISFS